MAVGVSAMISKVFVLGSILRLLCLTFGEKSCSPSSDTGELPLNKIVSILRLAADSCLRNYGLPSLPCKIEMQNEQDTQLPPGYFPISNFVKNAF